MRVQDLIERKRDGGALTPAEIGWLIQGYTAGTIPDYQMAAWLMAGFLRGLTEEETLALVEEMLRSGIVLDLSDLPMPKVDKHSTGGVGDKTSLVVAPAVAACGVAVPMISGRALAHTGGTLDKLEAIPGFQTQLSLAQFRSILARCGLCLIGQTEEIAPADRKLYALRDLTATVPFRPYMCASIMSKKLAEGIDGLVLDVKTGNGAFMRREEDARALAELMVRVGQGMGKRVTALLTDMDQPLGHWVGNGVETAEALAVLRGESTGDLAALCLELAARMLVVSGARPGLDAAREEIRSVLQSGAALERFRQGIELQGGDPRVCDDPGILPRGRFQQTICADRPGIVARLDTTGIGRIVMDWGAGRARLEDPIDLGVGLELHARRGDPVRPGDPLVTAWYNDPAPLDRMIARLSAAWQIEESPPAPRPLILAEI
ncbi:MAG: thymidine phosphorylase [Blastocatellia bacterium]|jgi:pyrimidine-nucleoside phosphorylase